MKSYLKNLLILGLLILGIGSANAQVAQEDFDAVVIKMAELEGKIASGGTTSLDSTSMANLLKALDARYVSLMGYKFYDTEGNRITAIQYINGMLNNHESNLGSMNDSLQAHRGAINNLNGRVKVVEDSVKTLSRAWCDTGKKIKKLDGQVLSLQILERGENVNLPKQNRKTAEYETSRDVHLAFPKLTKAPEIPDFMRAGKK